MVQSFNWFREFALMNMIKEVIDLKDEGYQMYLWSILYDVSIYQCIDLLLQNIPYNSVNFSYSSMKYSIWSSSSCSYPSPSLILFLLLTHFPVSSNNYLLCYLHEASFPRLHPLMGSCGIYLSVCGHFMKYPPDLLIVS